MKHSNDTFIYRELYNNLKEDILSFKYDSNEKLPSKREMAQNLNVSVNSVKTAYEQLLEEGYIYTQERKGYFIEPLEKLIVEPQVTNTVTTSTHQQEQQYRYSFSHMSTDITQFPVDTWTKLMKQVFKHYSHRLSAIPDLKGPIELRQAIAKLVSYKRGIQCNAQQIVIASGTNVLLKQIMDVMDDDSKIAVENPGYFRFRDILQKTKRTTLPINLDDKGISMSAIKSGKPDLVIVTPSHQFPMGTIMPVSRRIDLLNWLTKTNGYVIEDDYDSEFKYNTDNIPSLYSFDKSDRVIYLGTFSKTLMPGLRLSYMVLPTSLVTEFEHINNNVIPDFSMINALTLYLMIKDGHYERYIKKMSHFYAAKRAKLIEQLKETFQHLIKIHDTNAGLHFIVEVKTDYSYDDIEARAVSHEIELYTINRFTVEPVHDQSAFKTLIIGFSQLKIEVIPEAVDILRKVLID